MRKVGLILLFSVAAGLYFLLGGEEVPEPEHGVPTANTPSATTRDLVPDLTPAPDYGSIRQRKRAQPHQPYSDYPAYKAYPSVPTQGYTFRPLSEKEKDRLQEQRSSTPAYPESPEYQPRGPEPYSAPAPEPHEPSDLYSNPYAVRDLALAPAPQQPSYGTPYPRQPAADPYGSGRPYENPYGMQSPPPSTYSPVPAPGAGFRFRPYDERRKPKRWTENYAPPEQYMPYAPRPAPPGYYSPERDPSQRQRVEGPLPASRPLWAVNSWRY